MHALPLILTCLLTLTALSARAAAPAVARPTDDHGDPLPDGAAARLGTIRWRTRAPVMQPAFSPDGKWFATPDVAARTARLWDAATGLVVRTFRGHTDTVTAAVFSPDGKRLATISLDKTVRVWDTATGRQLHRAGPLDRLNQVAYSADGKSLVVVGDGHVVRFDASTGREAKRLKLPERAAHYISPHGDRVASGFFSGKPRFAIRDAASGEELCEIGTEVQGTRPAFSGDGKLFAKRVTKGPVKVWSVPDGKEVVSLAADAVGSALWLQFTPDGKGLLADREAGKLCVWDVATGKRTATFDTGRYMGSGAFSPDGKRLLVSMQSRLRMWDVATGKEMPGPAGIEGHCLTLAFSPDGKTLLTAGDDRVARLWDVATRKVVRELPLPEKAFVLGSAFSADGKSAAAVGGEVVIVWDVTTGKERHRGSVAKGRNTSATTVVFSPDGGTLFVCGFLDRVYRWDLKAGQALEPLGVGVVNWGRDMELTPDGKSLVVHGISGTHYFDIGTGDLIRTVKGPFGSTGSATRLSPDGKRIASVSTAAMVGIGSAEDGRVIRSWKAWHAGSLRYFGDGKYLAAASGEVLRVYDVEAGRSLPPIVGDFGGFGALEFSPDGKWLATSGGATVLLWEQKTLLRPPPYRMADAEFQECWGGLNLGGRVHVEGYQSLLQAAGDGMLERLREKVMPPRVDASRAGRLLKLVAGEGIEASKRATYDLVEMGPGVRPLIDKALEGRLDADARLRLVVARANLSPNPAAEALVAGRVVAVLKWVGTPKAKALLGDLAAGKAGRAYADAAKK